MQALSESNRFIGCQRSEAACACSCPWSLDVVEQMSVMGHSWSTRPTILHVRQAQLSSLSPCDGSPPALNSEYLYSMRTLRASRSVMSSTWESKAPCICFSRELRRSCMKFDFIRPLRACSLPTASAHRCDCLLSSACYSCAQPRLKDSISRPTKGASTMQPSSRYFILPLVFTAMSPSIACSCSLVALSFAPTITLHPY
jgi:hypothetical protein